MTEALLPGFRRPLEEQRRRSCESKHRFADELEAERAAHVWAVEKGEEIVAYGCGFCGGWHMGHAMSARAIREFMAWGTPSMERFRQEGTE